MLLCALTRELRDVVQDAVPLRPYAMLAVKDERVEPKDRVVYSERSRHWKRVKGAYPAHLNKNGGCFCAEVETE